MKDFFVAHEAMAKESSRMTANRKQILIALNSGYKVEDMLRDITVKTLLGLERLLQRSAARLVKAARVG